MSYSESSPSRSGKGKAKKSAHTKATRSPSASEISKNSDHFEMWCMHQNMERVVYDDIPDDFKKDVEKVFDMNGRLPLAWVDKDSKEYKSLSTFAPPSFISFIAQAYEEEPSLFGKEVQGLADLYMALSKVFSAWSHLKSMLSSVDKWSEADFTNVYAEFRRPAVQESTTRMQCCVSLPQPLLVPQSFEAARILSTKKSIPDCLLMISAESILRLSNSADSPFKRLKKLDTVKKAGSAVKRSSFAYQATIRDLIPDNPGFEFVSSIWEDKKPVHNLPEHAYRQNRMSTASAARHLYSMRVDAPVFGLTWAYGSVRAHVDWCRRLQPDEHPVVYSAPYVRPTKFQGRSDDKDCCEWQLGRVSDILQVHFLISNIDHWTGGEFVDRVVKGISALEKGIVKGGEAFEPWRRSGEIAPRPRRSFAVMESAEISANVLMQSTPPKAKRRTKIQAIY